MVPEQEKAKELLAKFTKYGIHQLSRTENCNIDAQTIRGSSVDNQLWRSIPSEYLKAPNIIRHISQQVEMVDMHEN
ncbi:hypothetical protein EV2_042194 [Malus domestica]